MSGKISYHHGPHKYYFDLYFSITGNEIGSKSNFKRLSFLSFMLDCHLRPLRHSFLVLLPQHLLRLGMEHSNPKEICSRHFLQPRKRGWRPRIAREKLTLPYADVHGVGRFFRMPYLSRRGCAGANFFFHMNNQNLYTNSRSTRRKNN